MTAPSSPLQVGSARCKTAEIGGVNSRTWVAAFPSQQQTQLWNFYEKDTVLKSLKLRK
jgi:hypothetical protein